MAGSRTNFTFSTTIVGSTPGSGAETVILTSPLLTLPFDNAIVLIYWYFLATVGTGSTSYTVGVRRGTSTSGTRLNGSIFSNCTAGNIIPIAGCYQDAASLAGTPQYSITVQGVGTTGAWNMQDPCIIAMAL